MVKFKFTLPFLPKKPPPPGVSPTAAKFAEGMVTVKDIIAPPAVEVDFDFLKIGTKFFRTLFVAGYPRFVTANWLSPLISFDHSLDVSMFIYPQESKEILDNLKRKVGEMEATIQSDIKRGRVIEPSVQVALEDALELQQQLAKGAERFFQFGLYITIPTETLDELNQVSKQVESTLAALLIITKKATLQMEEGFKSTLPQGQDRLIITRNMDTTSLGTTFPFTTSELTANEGILYGINEHNDSLVIFDRFTLENANTVVFGKSGGGKSYLVKLEILRSIMFGTEVIIIDPENEYETMCQAVGGEYITFSFNAQTKVNPFDLSQLTSSGENELGLKILSLHGLFKVIMGKLSPEEDALLDRALILTYKQKGITQDPQTQKHEPPLMEDLYKVLLGMEDAVSKSLADRIEKFIKGSLTGLINQQSNIDIKNPFTVFSIRDLADELRPIAMYILLDFIWTKIRRDIKRRVLIVDEAWYLMKYPDSANFLNSIAKRARKYYLGLTTITQDVEDFLAVDLGKAIVQNSSIQILLKQSAAAIDKIAEIFYLSEGEKHLLLSADVGEGLFFAGPAHVSVRVIASPDEHQLITTKPQELQFKKPASPPPPLATPQTTPQITPSPTVEFKPVPQVSYPIK
ncbi:MAG: Type IV secretory pathway VirB4 component-like protein [Candidatus Gottesmanbacteria bacterium GW2011_GWA2_42_16]|nr:MAG: Type IV secretory pathway VirB4 component-like protein [Candidatus Gottesmanbacteria bacterium GW2011_GWA2_42_16]